MDASLTAEADARSRRRSLAAVILSSLGVGVGFGLGYPLTAVALEQRGEASWIIGLAGAAPSVAILVLLPLLPRAIARVRPVHAIVTGCILSALGYLALYLSDNSVAWIAVRFLMGAGIALPWLIGETWINHVAQDATRTRVIAMYATAFFAGFAAGPLLLDVTGTDGLLPYAAGMAGSLLAALPIIYARADAPNLAHEPATGLSGGIRMAPAAMVGGFLGGYLETTHFSLLPSVALATGVTESVALQMLTVLLVGGLATQFLLGWIGDKTSRQGVLVALGVVYVGLTVLLPEALTTQATALTMMFVMGATVIGFYTLGLAILGEVVESRNLATANAAFIMVYTAGGILGPALTGAAMTVAPLGGFALSTASAALILTLLTLRVIRRR